MYEKKIKFYKFEGILRTIYLAGMMILIFSYANHFRFSVTAENATVNKDELKYVIKKMEEEINILHEITQSPENFSCESKNGNLQIRMIN